MHKHKPESMFCLVQLTARGYLRRGWRLPPRAPPPPGKGCLLMNLGENWKRHLYVNSPEYVIGVKLKTISRSTAGNIPRQTPLMEDDNGVSHTWGKQWQALVHSHAFTTLWNVAWVSIGIDSVLVRRRCNVCTVQVYLNVVDAPSVPTSSN